MIRAGDFRHFPKEKWILSGWYNLRFHMATNKSVSVYLRCNVA